MFHAIHICCCFRSTSQSTGKSHTIIRLSNPSVYFSQIVLCTLGPLIKDLSQLMLSKRQNFLYIRFGWVDLCLVSRNVLCSLSQVMIQKPAMRKAWIVAVVCPWVPHLLGWVETGLNVAYEGFVPLRKQKKKQWTPTLTLSRYCTDTLSFSRREGSGVLTI